MHRPGILSLAALIVIIAFIPRTSIAQDTSSFSENFISSARQERSSPIFQRPAGRALSTDSGAGV